MCGEADDNGCSDCGSNNDDAKSHSGSCIHQTHEYIISTHL